MNDLFPTCFKDDVWIWVIVKGQVLVWDPKATKEACIDVCEPCHLWDFHSNLGHHLRLCRYLRAMLPLGPQWHSDPGQSPCLCLWSVLLSSGPWCYQRQKKMPRVYVVSLDHAGVWGLCHHQGHDNLIDWHCHLRQWCPLCQCCCWGPCLEPWLCHNQDLCWCLYLLIPSKAMRMPQLWATI